ncbi:hypothetical protein CAMRE0001_1323 [Campylobacter rectus RM3267]|uniref:Uncharacterized protein n=1 Tax=Campylobacter rectus RM3267 TaxID=553218 RepID=B9D014_CAMRE|nr:hypothetical protein CAMRE0001_1323 [Campylobacter rectus RM3267]
MNRLVLMRECLEVSNSNGVNFNNIKAKLREFWAEFQTPTE